MEVTGIEQWLREKRGEGWSKLGILHLIVAAYVRTVTMRPGINRFVAGRRLFARNEIQVVLSVKRSASIDASETSIKVSFSPTDTVFDVYRRLTAAMDEVQADLTISPPEQIAGNLMRLPRFLLRLAMTGIRMLDYFDWLPAGLLEASPFHGSLVITDLGSLRIRPVFHHIYNFGTLPVFIAFGAKRHAYELDRHGNMVDRKYIDCKFTIDERTTDGHYWAQAFQAWRYIFQHPEILEQPPTRIVEDVY
jgi:hypothetical protein